MVGNEFLRLAFVTPSLSDEFAYRGEYFIYKCSDMVRQGDRLSVYVLHFISKEAVLDQNKKISKTFKGKEKVQLSHAEKAKVYKTPSDSPSSGVAEPSHEPKTDHLQPSEDEPLTEGKIRQVSLTIHERNRKYRQICLTEHGYVCAACGMDFEKFYGEIGREFIEVHHLERIADTDGEHEIDPKTDLVPLCSNCHSMIHRKKGGKPFTLDELKQRYKGPKWNEI